MRPYDLAVAEHLRRVTLIPWCEEEGLSHLAHGEVEERIPTQNLVGCKQAPDVRVRRTGLVAGHHGLIELEDDRPHPSLLCGQVHQSPRDVRELRLRERL